MGQTMRTLAVAIGMTLLLTAVSAAQVVPPFSMTRLYTTEAEFARAIQPYQRAIAANPRNARAQYWLGFAYLYAYRQWIVSAAPYASAYLERAVPPLQEAIKLDPLMVEGYLALQDAYQLMGDLDKANETVALMLRRTRPGWLPGVPAPAP